MHTILAAFAAIALVAGPVAAFAQGHAQAKKSGTEVPGTAVAKGKDKDKTKEHAAAARSNKGGETRGKARADEVKDLNQQKKPGG